MTPALAPQLGLLGSPSDPVGRFTMREGPSLLIVRELALPMLAALQGDVPTVALAVRRLGNRASQ